MILTKETQVIQALEDAYDQILKAKVEIKKLANTLEAYTIDNFAREPIIRRDMDTDDVEERFGKVKEMLRYAQLMKDKITPAIKMSPFVAHKDLDSLSEAMLLMHEFMRTITTDFKKLDLETIEAKLIEFRKWEK